MRFYTQQHQFYAGIDLHARSMHACVLDQAGTVLLDRNLPCHFPTFLQATAPYREGLVVGVECMFGWYWLADRCAEQQIPFVLGHALYMKFIHGGKAKNDRIDAHKSALIAKVELHRTRTAKVDDVQTYHRLRTVPGVGPILALLYEMHQVDRFEKVGQFLSYARLVSCAHESAGKKRGSLVSGADS